jgi:hypothetical protein
MKGTRVRDVLAFLGVVASLLFVGVEIRQNTSATKGQTRQELAALNQEWLILLTADSAFSEIFTRTWVNGGEVKPEEAFRVEMMMTLNMRRLENVFFQYQEGLVDETALGSYGLQSMGWTPRFMDWWVAQDWRAAFHPDFVEFVESRAPAP